MRDADALRLAREALEHLGTITERMPEARAKLREWKSEGFPAGLGESSTGGGRHSDPTAAAVTALAIVNRQTGKQTGWKERDPFGERLAAIDHDLIALHSIAKELAADVAKLIALPRRDGAGGCELCDDVTLPVDRHGRPLHECDDLCESRDHRHPSSYQVVYSRAKPRTDNPLASSLRDIARCRFHYEFAQRYGVDAHRDITRWHLDHLGARIPYDLIRRCHPDEFKASHGGTRTHA